MKKPPADYSKGGFFIPELETPYPLISAKASGWPRT